MVYGIYFSIYQLSLTASVVNIREVCIILYLHDQIDSNAQKERDSNTCSVGDRQRQGQRLPIFSLKLTVCEIPAVPINRWPRYLPSSEGLQPLSTRYFQKIFVTIVVGGWVGWGGSSWLIQTVSTPSYTMANRSLSRAITITLIALGHRLPFLPMRLLFPSSSYYYLFLFIRLLH